MTSVRQKRGSRVAGPDGALVLQPFVQGFVGLAQPVVPTDVPRDDDVPAR